MAISTATLVGNLVADPELRYTPNGTPCATFRVATNGRYRDDQGAWKDLEAVYWHCEAWKESAEIIANEFKQGMPVIVTGTHGTKNWETKEGEKRSRLIVKVDAMGHNTLLAMRRKLAAVSSAPAMVPADVAAEAASADGLSVEQGAPADPDIWAQQA
jgi:single stranded DNA-binding protein